MQENSILHSIAAVAAFLEVHEQTVRRLIREGELPATKIGSRYRISEQAVIDYLNSHRITPSVKMEAAQ